MVRRTTVAGAWAALTGVAFAFLVAGCSATPTSSGTETPLSNPGPGSDQSSSSGTGGASSAPSAQGSSGQGGSGSVASPSGTGSSAGSSGTSKGASTGASGGSSAGSTSGAQDAGQSADAAVGPLGSIAGCGQGTSCMAGNDLAVPASADGIQLATPANGITVQPGQESFLCYYRTLPNTATIDIGAFQSWMTPGSSHHFIAYQQSGATAGAQPDGTLINCQFGGGTWIYATSLPGVIVNMQMPTGVGLPMAANTQVMLNMHFINPGSQPVSPAVKMNLMYGKNIKYTAASMTSFNPSIDIPAATAAGPGTQTVSGTCTAPVGSNFFIVTSHTHKHATLAEVNFVSNGTNTNLVHTTDWEHPDARMWPGPNFLTVQQGDSFTYSCSYSNTGSTPVTVGETAANNEMCMAIAYYFPAGNASCR